MTQFEQVLIDAVNTQLRDSAGKVNQTDRNALRNRLMAALANDLNAVMTVDGAIVEFPHEYWGSLAVEVSVKMKDPNYDTETAHKEYVEKVEKAEAKRLETERKAAERASKVKAQE
jgi:cell division septum initiation protein DivIVA